jgi:transketolase
MRTSFIEELTRQARAHPDIFLVVGDLGYSVVEPFAEEFPNRYLNAGVAEQNMTGLAAGLAAEGWHVFTYSIANFPTFRCAEQIRNDVAYHNLPVTIVAVGGGLSYGKLGYSHHAVQDYALLRVFPGMSIAAPGDPHETRACVRQLAENPCPSYLRLGKAGEPLVHTAEPRVAAGEPLPVSGNADAKKLLLTTGATLKMAKDALDGVANKGWRLCSLPLWSEETKPALAAALERYDTIVTAEDHLRAGGFGSFVSEALDEAGLQKQVRRVALSGDVCGLVADQNTLNERGGVSVAAIRKLLD